MKISRKKEKRIFEMVKTLSKRELHFIRGGEAQNTEQKGGQ